MAYGGKTAIIDTKTIGKGSSYAHSQININQVYAMMQLVPHGTIGGFVIWFRGPNKVLFFKAQVLLDCWQNNSVKFEQGLDLGPIEDPQLKRIFDGNI